MKKTRKKIITAVLVLFFIIIALFLSQTKSKLQYDFVLAQKQNVTQEISATGKITSSQNVNLSFEKSGKISRVFVKAGDRAIVNQILVQQNSADLSSQYAQAKAQIQSAQAQAKQYRAAHQSQKARLDEMKKGTRPEEIEIKKSELKNAEQNLQNEYADILNVFQKAYELADEAVRIKTSIIFFGSKNTSYKLMYNTCDYQAEIDSVSLRADSEYKLDAWREDLLGLELASNEQKEGAIQKSLLYLHFFQNFLLRTNDTLIAPCNLNNSSLDSHRTNSILARSNIITAIDNIINKKQAISTQKLTIERIQNELNLKLAGFTKEQIQSQEASVLQAEANIESQEAIIRQYEANLANISAQIAKTSITAPFNGIVTKIDAKVGEIVPAGKEIISLISEGFSTKNGLASGWEIEANIPEVDIAKIAIGNTADITLDAYSSDVMFHAKVSSIDPAETIIDGVPTYKIKLQLENKDEKIKSGMTANINIIAQKKENIISIPQKSIIQKGQEKFVRIADPSTEQKQKVITYIEKKVITGIKGSDGNVEILDGVSESDKIITFLEEK